jgi:hypothetical protein
MSTASHTVGAYGAKNTGTTGATAPTHLVGNESDGTVIWEYFGTKFDDIWTVLKTYCAAAFATPDHYVPTAGRDRIDDAELRDKIDTLAGNASAAGIVHFPLHDARQGIAHVVSPEQGLTQPGITLVTGGLTNSGVGVNKVTTQTDTLTNTSGVAIPGPVYLVLDSLVAGAPLRQLYMQKSSD